MLGYSPTEPLTELLPCPSVFLSGQYSTCPRIFSSRPYRGPYGRFLRTVQIWWLQSEIQKELEDAYEKCRAELIAQGQIYVGQTITAGGQYGKLEHKPGPNGTGKSYALRIPNSGMKKMLTMANSTFNQLFEST